MPNKPNKLQNFFIKTIGVDKYLEAATRPSSISMIRTDDESFKQTEYKVWYEGEPQQLEYFYKTNLTNYVYPTHWFWRAVNTDIPRIHYPLASAISDAYGNLLFSNQPHFEVDSGSKTRNATLRDQISKLNRFNQIHTLLQDSAQKQSYSGSVALKLNLDTTFSDIPAITSYPKESFKTYKRYGKVIYIDFIDYFDDEYKLVSRYGMGYISYKLYKGDREVPVDSFSETSGLRDIAFVDQNEDLIPVIFATVVPNKSGERSDYEGLISSFHALDEIYSSLVNYVRRTKPVTFYSEDIAKKDAKGKALPLNKFDTDIEILDGTTEGETTDITRNIPELKIQGFKEAYDSIRENILATVGLSPGTLGLQVGGSREASESLNIRERVSMRSREEKLSIWKERLQEFYYAAVVLFEAIEEAEEISEGIFQIDEVPEFEVNIDFGDYISESTDSKIERYAGAYQDGVVSIGFAIAKMFGDELNEEQLMYLIIDTKKERGIPLTEIEQEFDNEHSARKQNKQITPKDYL